ncbi:LacI family DNA-binding transcriptional regulator [Glutamicibacter sp. JC586]|uniref:LacI family DNA-binding transcriptional regulator n=1 Tax=Glutamicibacter sp. JC586 TaxID=2590552 RepID=UPI00135680EE|nr:LacI family DNA-binding transcriptional regulator [Glutamicibacter sp. JC586]
MIKDRSSKHGAPVTMKDIAKEAGVSVATVSHVVNNKPGARIGEETRQRVHEAVELLGYRTNALAKNLSSGSSRFIGLVADAIATTPFAGQIIHGAQDEAWKHGYVLLVANTDGNQAAESDAIAMMLEHQVRGILYSTWYHREIEVPDPLLQTDTVLVNCFSTGSGLPAVVPDEEQGGKTATQELIASGHQRIAFINTTTPSPALTGRLAGYRSALEDAGVAYDKSLVIPATPEQEGGYEATTAVVASGATAVFCHNDRVAMGLYDGLRVRGLDVPTDVSVVGFDNQEVIAAHLRPPLTTVALPHYELGAAGIRVLLGIDPEQDKGTYLIDCPAIRRQSV